MKLPTASSLHRCLACPASAVLPRAPSTTSEAAERGTAIHAYLEAWALSDGFVRPDAPADYEDTCHGIDFEAIRTGRIVLEVESTFAFDVQTGRVRSLGCGLGRDYGALRPNEIAGTADLLLGDPDGSVCVLDYKTGQSVGAAASNPQMLFLGLCAARAWGAESVAVELVYLAEDGSHRTDRAVLDSLDLDSFAAQLRAAVALWRSPEAATQARPGEWCRYCPCFDSCPAQHQLARSFSSGLLDPAAVQALTPEAAGAAWAKLEHYEALLTEIKKQLKERAHRQPLILPSGSRLGYVEAERRSIDAAVAERVLTERYGPEKARECLEAKTTQAAISRAFKGRGEALRVIREIEAAGGIRVGKFTKLAELPAQLE
jgi:hypothetical protein